MTTVIFSEEMSTKKAKWLYDITYKSRILEDTIRTIGDNGDVDSKTLLHFTNYKNKLEFEISLCKCKIREYKRTYDYELQILMDSLKLNK